MLSGMPGPEDVLAFWFGDIGPDGLSSVETSRRWFTKSDAFDDEIRARFGELHEEVAAGGHEDWQGTPRGTLAYVIVLDQFSRNLFRGSPRTFACDDRALAAARSGIERGFDEGLAAAER